VHDGYLDIREELESDKPPAAADKTTTVQSTRKRRYISAQPGRLATPYFFRQPAEEQTRDDLSLMSTGETSLPHKYTANSSLIGGTYMYTNGPVSKISKLPELFREGIENSNQWRSERAQPNDTGTTVCWSITRLDDPCADGHFNVTLGHQYMSDLNELLDLTFATWQPTSW